MKRFLIVILLAAACNLASPGYGQYKPETKSVAGPGDSKKKKDAETTEKNANLDQLIAEALKNNPDLRVAEAKVRAAEAELYRTRIRVTTELQTVQAEIDAAEAVATEGFTRFKVVEKLFKNGSISREDYGAAFLTYMKLKADEAAARAKLPYLLGKQIGTSSAAKFIDETIRKAWEQNVKDTAITDDEFIRRAMLDILGRTPQPQEIAKFKSLPESTRRRQLLDELVQSTTAKGQPAGVDSIWIEGAAFEKLFPKIYPDTPMTDKLRKALDAPVHLNSASQYEFNPMELLGFVSAELSGVNLQVRYKATKDQKIAIKFRNPVALGAFLQYVEDELHCVFILRDYGVVVVTAEEKLPPGALRVTDFWKQSKASDASMVDSARTQVKGPLTDAMQAYFRKHASTWPPNLDALLQKDKFGGPYLENADWITDPWGKRYQYDLKGPKNNGAKPDIWTIAPDGGIVGNWPEVRAP